MTSANTRSALSALDAVRPLIVRLDERRHPEDAAADLIEGWAGVETALRAMVGGSSLAGQALVSDVRAAGLLDYPHAHALLGFLAARDRATRPDYQPSSEDVAAAQAGFQAIEAANGAGIAADTATHPTPRQVPPAVGAPPPVATPGFAAPRANGGASLPPPPAPRPPAQPAGRVGPPAAAAYDRDGDHAPRYGEPRGRRSPALLVGLLALVALLAAGGYYLFGPARRGRDLDAGIAAYQGGRRDEARRAFEAAAAANPRLALPHVFLGRMAREEGDLPRATSELTTAIQLEPANATAQREMGSVQLVSGQPQLAVNFFRRALEADGNDRLAAGGMACALMQQGNAQVADRFFARAGSGPWDACRQLAPGAALPGAMAAPGAAAPPAAPR